MSTFASTAARDSLMEVTTDGAFKRTASGFRSFVKRGASAGNAEIPSFLPETGRYHGKKKNFSYLLTYLLVYYLFTEFHGINLLYCYIIIIFPFIISNNKCTSLWLVPGHAASTR